MTNQHPITPPPELLEQWSNNPRLTWLERLSLAYAAGADQELEACCAWLKDFPHFVGIEEQLHAARRPKPPSLKEQALGILDVAHHDVLEDDQIATIRRALKELPE
jgi:hypothetical protein